MNTFVVCIATYNQPETIKLCLDCIVESTIQPTAIIVSDNSCNKIVQDESLKHHAIYLPGFSMDGYCKGMNRAVSYALRNYDTDYILLLTGDIFVFPHAIQLMIGRNHGVVGRIINTGNTRLPNIPRFPVHFPGNFWLLPTSALRQLDFIFDENLWSYGEDTDLVFRMRRIKTIQEYIPEAMAVHESDGPFNKTPTTKTFFLIRNSLRNAIKYNDWVWFFKLLIGHLIYKPRHIRWIMKGILNELNIGLWRANPPQSYSELSSSHK